LVQNLKIMNRSMIEFKKENIIPMFKLPVI
jgi:hypothetical protein